ncbi:MAG: NlpC/P60 family protein [Sphingomonas sp.]
MGNDRAAIVARARILIGTPFRPQGRSETGLDCVGLVAAALNVDAPADYPVRGGSVAQLAAALATAGLRRVRARRPGDMLAMRSGPEQLHLGIWTGDGIIHADARLRRAVERPGEPQWPVLGIWRLRSGTWRR